MDFGLKRGNYILISTPPNVNWDEMDIYHYLVANDEARMELSQRADKKHCSTWSNIWVHHDTLLCPFLLPPNITDEELKKFLCERLYSLITPPRITYYLSNDYRLVPVLATNKGSFV